ncbi:MAG: hypothetical protein DIU56_014865 [Pseudomonadota bacterium]
MTRWSRSKTEAKEWCTGAMSQTAMPASAQSRTRARLTDLSPVERRTCAAGRRRDILDSMCRARFIQMDAVFV